MYTTTELAMALSLAKTRLNRLDETLDEYLGIRLESAYAELKDVQGIEIDAALMNELMFWVDFAVWQYQCRDKPGAMPEWMLIKRAELYRAKHFAAWKAAQS